MRYLRTPDKETERCPIYLQDPNKQNMSDQRNECAAVPGDISNKQQGVFRSLSGLQGSPKLVAGTIKACKARCTQICTEEQRRPQIGCCLLLGIKACLAVLCAYPAVNQGSAALEGHINSIAAKYCYNWALKQPGRLPAVCTSSTASLAPMPQILTGTSMHSTTANPD